MPLYEYKCDSCGDVFEVIQKFSDTPLAVHGTCGGQLERLVSTSALMFKGSGWYVNDYGKGNSKDPKAKPAAENGASSSDKANGSSSPAESSTKSEKSTKTESSSPAPSTTPKP